MDRVELIDDIIATYQRHGWTLRRVLLRPDTLAALSQRPERFSGVDLRESDFDALWFARASHGEREAWELRLVSQQAYALFELFENDEPEDRREEARREMENRMREFVRN